MGRSDFPPNMRSGILSDTDIHTEIAKYEHRNHGLNIEPFDPQNVQPASYDLTLGDTFQRQYQHGPGSVQSVENGAVDRVPQTVGEDIDELVVQPQEFVLGHTEECIHLPPYISGEVKGRSSVGRMGLIPHTAGWIDPGFTGQITLEFVNHSERPVKIEPGQRIAQVVFSYTNRPATKPYGEKEDSKYQGQTGVTESRIEQDKN